MLTPILLALAAQLPQGYTVAQGDKQLTIGGQLRFRHETRDPSVPVDGASSASGSIGRFRLTLDAKSGKDVRGFLQLQSVVASDGLASEEGLHQAFAEIYGVASMADVQVGRFEMLYADELLISNGDWGKTGTAFDGIRIRRKDEHYWADLFLTQPVEGQGVATGVDQSFGGLWVGVPAGDFSFEAYGLVRDDRHDFGAGSDDMTIGGRAKWSPKDGPTIKGEVATQTGDHGALDAGGMLAMFDAGMPVTSAVTAGVNVLYASGDDNAADGNDDAFKPLFHTPHKILGAADLVQLTNVLDLQVYSRYKPSDSWRFLGAFHWMTLAEEDGALPDLRGGLTKAAGEGDLGMEIDLMAWYTINSLTEIHFGISDFLAGDAIQNGDDQIWVFAQLLLNL